MIIIKFISLVTVSYLLGSIPFGYLIGKIFKKIDIRKYGSHNIGATNVFRVMGKIWGVICLILDTSKGYIPVTLIANLFYLSVDGIIPLTIFKIFLGLAAICGHIWPIYLKFKGGKGVATAFGVLVGIEPISILIAGGIWLLIVAIFRIVSLGSILAALSLPFIEAFRGIPIEIILFSIIVVLIVVLQHRENIKRLIKRDEKKI